MQTRTICCKLTTAPSVESALRETSQRFSEACNYVLETAVKEKQNGAIELHKLCYYQIRRLFDLSANLAVRAIRRVVACLTKLKKKRRQPKKFLPKSIDYDARIFSYREEEEMVSLTTTQGRIRIPLLLGKHQRERLKGKRPTSAIAILKGKIWCIHISVEIEEALVKGNGILGVDLGLKNIATLSTGRIINGFVRQEFKKKRAQIRASLQSRGTKGAKKNLKKLSCYENRRIKYENHVISRQIVEEAKGHDCGTIRMERLKNIRDNTKTWNKHRNRMMVGWSFYQLQQFVAYKPAACGISVEFVNPAYTSQTCHRCLCLGSRNGDLFSCLTCGEQHADVNASHMIALGGAVCKPARISDRKVS